MEVLFLQTGKDLLPCESKSGHQLWRKGKVSKSFQKVWTSLQDAPFYTYKLNIVQGPMLVNLPVVAWHGLHCISRAAFFQWRHQREAIIIYGSKISQNVNKVRVVSLNLDETEAKAGRQISSSFQFSWFNYFFDQNQTATEVLSQKQRHSPSFHLRPSWTITLWRKNKKERHYIFFYG